MTLDKEKKLGVPRHYSLFYSVGLSLVGVGVMSSCYHICPTDVTFQFDTTYMYLMAFFMFLKLYQNRHPDLVCSAFKGFVIIGCCLILEVSIHYMNSLFFFILDPISRLPPMSLLVACSGYFSPYST